MNTNTCFIKSIAEAAANSGVVLPWTRGSRRAMFIAKRAELEKGVRMSTKPRARA